jgi:hypothetical protein
LPYDFGALAPVISGEIMQVRRPPRCELAQRTLDTPGTLIDSHLARTSLVVLCFSCTTRSTTRLTWPTSISLWASTLTRRRRVTWRA